jgi:Spy/CpxP family protein refolding chaperone
MTPAPEIRGERLPPREEQTMHHHAWGWRRARLHHFRQGLAFAYAGCAPGVDVDRGEWMASSGRFREEEPFGAGSIGVRRPLRWLAYRLDLSREQVSRAAKILESLKIERAQASVDLRRAASDLADAVETGEFGRSRVEAASQTRLAAAQRVQQAVTRALEALHELLDPEQREKLAALIRAREIAF